MGIYSVKPLFQEFLKPVESLCVKFQIHPTTINIMALVLSIIGGICLWLVDENHILYLIYIPFMAFFRTALNALDGMVARAMKVENQQFGEVLNEFFDRISDASIFVGLAMASYTNNELGFLTTILILLNSYLSIVCKAAGGERQYGGVMGKADRMVYLGLMALVMLILRDYISMEIVANCFLWFFSVGMLITMFTRFTMIKVDLYKE